MNEISSLKSNDFILIVGSYAYVDLNTLSCFKMIDLVYMSSNKIMEGMNNSANFRKLLETKPQYDVIIVQVYAEDALLALGHYFNAPIIGVSPFGASKWTTDLTGAPNFASYIPHPMSGYTDRMNFWQRMYNSFCYWYEDIMMVTSYTPVQQQLLEDIYPNGSKMPSLDEIKRNISLVLLNTHVTLGTVRPNHPNMIEVGGLFIENNSDALPSDIKTFLDDAKHGVIYVAFGSNIEFSRLPDSDKNAILNSFNEYPKIRLIIKTTVDLSIPSHHRSDILLKDWLPQQEILAHPNVKLYITHGGEHQYRHTFYEILH